jgi:hypothetical protein
MINGDELKVVTGAVTAADATIGTVVPNNMRRRIYRVKFINTFAGVNRLIIGKRENGAVGTTPIDYIQTAVPNQMECDPEDLLDDSAPLYTIEGPAQGVGITPVGTSVVRAQCSAGGTGFFTYWYIDSPSDG